MNGQLSNRRHGRGCPLCANKVVSSTNNLAAKYPELSAEWHPSKNGNLTPDQVIAHSAQMVWWKCPVADDHEWESIVFNRSKHGNGCPACAGFIPTEGHNLAALLPELVEQWHPTKNGDLLSQQLTPSSATLIWWACPVAEDHQWQATPGARVIDMQEGTFKGCPFCANLYASTSNSLAELFPEIALEWHPTKNGELTAERVVQGSNK